MNENAQWQMIKDSVLFTLSSGFSVSLFHFYLGKNRLEVYCSVFLLFSRCIDHFICYSRNVYIGDSRVRHNRWPVASIFTVGPVTQNKDRTGGPVDILGPLGPATFVSSNR